MTPHIELTKRIKEAKKLVIDGSGRIFGNRTAERHHANPMRLFCIERAQRIAYLERALAMTNEDFERAWAFLHQSMQNIR